MDESSLQGVEDFGGGAFVGVSQAGSGERVGALLGAPACDGNPWKLLQVTATLGTIWRKVSPVFLLLLLLLLLLKGEMETVTAILRNPELSMTAKEPPKQSKPTDGVF